MIELLWAWRVWFRQITPDDVPPEIRATVAEIVASLQKKEREPVWK